MPRSRSTYTDSGKILSPERKQPNNVIQLIVNGENRHFEEAPTVAQLLEKLELAGKRVALERNGDIVPRSRFGEERLADGDRLEIVVAVGGG